MPGGQFAWEHVLRKGEFWCDEYGGCWSWKYEGLGVGKTEEQK